MDLSARQQTNRGYSDATARGFELALVPVVFGGLGWWLDGVFGTGRILTLVLAIFGVIGIGVKMWLQYDADMTRHESGAIWSRSNRSATGSGPAPGGRS